MQIVRTIAWVLILFAILAFSFFNWEPVEVTLWDNLVLETKVPALVIVAFLLGALPMWLYHRSVKWSLQRRIRSLENSIKSNAMSRRHDPDHGDAPAPAATQAPKSVDSDIASGDTLTPTPRNPSE
ncbi:LapA family protein [Erythrobacter sp.]|uniref:LapA family protein n=1 Tax=Erythrobacter sp. TaxID=1042 RepID=UPI001425F521|nr:LapA family protein [Erythrobacter sp.]QIQ85841.1 MAG: LapA family protein [Erythrobacter sp.]